MKSFSVLDRNLAIHQNYLLEASAGTGKTFSIENIVVRLLIEEPVLSLEEILVVTFTRAATADLKRRIRSNIEQAIVFIEKGEDAPDYLIPHIGSVNAKRRLEQALFTFDQAQIFTIHGFCARMLQQQVFEGDLNLDAVKGEDPLPCTEILRVIRDFFRTEVRPERYSKEQIRSVLKLHGSSMEKLEKVLLNLITQPLKIVESLPDFSILLDQFNQTMVEWKRESRLSADRILEDLLALAPSYRGLCLRSGELKQDVVERIEQFGGLFSKDSWTGEDLDWVIADQLSLVEAFDPSRLRAKATLPEQIHYPNLREEMGKRLGRYVKPLYIFAKMGSDCQKLLRRRLEEEEKLGFDELLTAMQRGLGNSQFVEGVRQLYRAAIIDEFQDTDPIQWEIFRRLFPPGERGWGNLYIVGPPRATFKALSFLGVRIPSSNSRRAGRATDSASETVL